MQIVPSRSANRYISHAYIYIYPFSFKNPADSLDDLYVAKVLLIIGKFPIYRSLRIKAIDHDRAKSTCMDGYFAKGRYIKMLSIRTRSVRSCLLNGNGISLSNSA